MHMHIQSNTYTYKYICMYMCIYIYTHIYTCTCIHTHINNIHAQGQALRIFLFGTCLSVWIETPSSHFNHLTLHVQAEGRSKVDMAAAHPRKAGTGPELL